MKESFFSAVFLAINRLEGVPKIVVVEMMESWSRTSFSMNLDIKGRFETGPKFLSTFGSNDFFFKRGFTMADFIHEGKMPVAKD